MCGRSMGDDEMRSAGVLYVDGRVLDWIKFFGQMEWCD